MFRVIVPVLLSWVLAWPAWAAPVAAQVRKGNAAYARGDYGTALEKYKEAAARSPGEARIDYNIGAAEYKLGNYPQAIAALNKSLLSDDAGLVGNAHYNLGNLLFRTGISAEDKDLNAAVKSLEESLTHFDKVIEIAPKDKVAVHDREITSKELERLRKKLQEQQKNGTCSRKDGQKDPSSPKDKNSSSDPSRDKPDGQKGQDQDKGQDKAGDERGAEQDNKQSVDQEAMKPDAGKKNEGRAQTSAAGDDNGEGLTQEEADRLLDSFAQNDQPHGILNFDRDPRQEKPVLRDW